MRVAMAARRRFVGRLSTKRYSKAKVSRLLSAGWVLLLICILGDYQFDIYRLMRKHNGGRWADFRPLTNVMVCPHHSIDRIAFQ
jgi:hypothetical protein